MPMSSRFRKTLGIAALLGLVLLTGFFINAFYGNPVSALLARNTARQVLEEQFPGEPYTIESCGYNLKNGCYTVRVSREGSMDDWFDIDVEPDGTFHSHDYADRVPNCRNTWNRLSQDYYDLGKTVMELPDFPEGKASLPGVSGESVYVSAHLRFCDREYPEEYSIFVEDLKVDGVYDLAELGAVAGELNVRAVNEDLTPETAASIMLKIHELTEEAGIRYAVMDFSLERQENSREPEDYIAAPLFPVSEITPDGLAERIREADAAYKAWVEAEDAAAQEAENAEKGTT